MHEERIGVEPDRPFGELQPLMMLSAAFSTVGF